MKIKRLGFTSFKISTEDVDIITDPLLAVEAGLSFSKTVADVVLLSDGYSGGEEGLLQEKGFNKIEKKDRDRLFEIASPGEYEVGGVLVRRDLGSDLYVIDEGHVRIVYLGKVSHKVELDDYSDLGDVDLLIVPVGDSEIFPKYELIEKIVTKLDPTYLIPSGYLEEGLDKKYADLKSVDEFIKYFGYTHVTKNKNFKITSGSEPDNKVIEIVVLE